MKPNPSNLTQVQGSKMKLSNIIKAMIVAAATMLTLANTAMAQSKTLVVDSEKVLADSKAVKGIMSQLQAVSKTMETEMKPQINTIVSDQKKLETSAKGLTNQQLSARPDLKQMFSSLQQNKAKAANEKQYKDAEMQKTMSDSLAKVGKKLKPIIDAIARERGADVIIDKRNAMYASPSVDITAEVLRRLDAQLPYVQVTRARIPRQAAKK